MTAHTPEYIGQWLLAQQVHSLQCDSRRLQPGDAFVAWPGAVHDGRQHVAAALAAGARACLVEQAGVEVFAFADPRVLPVAGLKEQAGAIAHHFYQQPSTQLPVVAITGTNGKTSTAWWTAQLLGALGQPAAVVGTLGLGVPGQTMEVSGLTTPDPIQLQAGLHRFMQQGVRACVIEASSIGLEEGRMNALQLHTAVFTNFTQDHLDYHGSMAAYWQAKRALFNWPGLRAAVVNVDDPQGLILAQELAQAEPSSGLALWTVSASGQNARLQVTQWSLTHTGLRLTVQENTPQGPAAGTGHTLEVPLVGEYNLYNLLCALATARVQGHALADAVRACTALTPVPGRMQAVNATAGGRQPLVLVDYAHTPDALDKALRALQPLAQQRGGQLWCVVGCGGNRDAGKRPQMAAVAEQLAQQLVLTSDNPRHENPLHILAQMQAGLRQPQSVRVLADRAAAIALAVAQAQAQDVVLLAGKGHEDYQDVAGVKTPFSDAAVAAQALQARVTPRPTVAQLLAALPGAQVVGDGSSVPVQRVHSDTRTLATGDLFVALRGERFDANDYLPQARQAGAVLALAERGLAAAGLPGVEVPDSRLALGELARRWRAQFQLPLIAVTGSNGKTTVTQMLASILRAAAGEGALATQGNFNNDIGVPLTLLRLRPEHRLAVVELGMNHPGEIAGLAAMAQPTVALVNNAQREHQEFMASVEAVARENAECFRALSAQGTAVFPADDAYTPLWRELAQGRPVLTFGEGGDVQGSAHWQGTAWQVQVHTPMGSLGTQLHIAGRHNVRNAWAATACALAAGVPLAAIEQGLRRFEPVNGRSRALSVRLQGRDVALVDDSYNANPDSVRAAIAVLAELPGPRLLALGDMGEVGEQGLAFHDEVLREALACGLEHVWVSGDWMAQASAPLLAQAGGRLRCFSNVEDLVAQAQTLAPHMGSVLVKGSRFMRMERLVQALCAQAEQAKQGVQHAA